jgi:hypothetical protein
MRTVKVLGAAGVALAVAGALLWQMAHGVCPVP